MIQAQVVADSLNEFGNRLTTLLITFPRYILAELNTHRVLSKNSASSRAIPFKKMVESVERNPFVPYAWQEDHKGMQGTVYLDSKPASYLHETLRDDIKAKDILDGIWGKVGGFERSEGSALYHAIRCAEELNMHKATKQLANRLLEPFMWHTVLISGTEWENFFELRCPKYTFHNDKEEYVFKSRKEALKQFSKDEPVEGWNKTMGELALLDWLKLNQGQADIHMMFLAEAIWDALNESNPKQLKAGDWHMPLAPKFLTYKEGDQTVSYTPNPAFEEEIIDQVKIATANCARTSYTVVGEEAKERLSTEDIKLHNRLLESGHLSPFEHCAQAMSDVDLDINFRSEFGKVEEGWCRNFKGFIQYRALLENGEKL